MAFTKKSSLVLGPARAQNALIEILDIRHNTGLNGPSVIELLDPSWVFDMVCNTIFHRLIYIF